MIHEWTTQEEIELAHGRLLIDEGCWIKRLLEWFNII